MSLQSTDIDFSIAAKLKRKTNIRRVKAEGLNPERGL